MYRRTYIICTLTLSHVFALAQCLLIITCIILEIKLFTTVNTFAGVVKTQKLTRVPFVFLVCVCNVLVNAIKIMILIPFMA